MIEIIRPIPPHIDRGTVTRLCAMHPEQVRGYLDHAQWERRERTQREDRDEADRKIEAAQFVLSELEPTEIRIRRERATVERLEHQLHQFRAIVSGLEAEMAAHCDAIAELCLLAQQSEATA